MPRPVKKRTAKSYMRDVESLGRLRTALLMDTGLATPLKKEATDQIDDLVKTLINIVEAEAVNGISP